MKNLFKISISIFSTVCLFNVSSMAQSTSTSTGTYLSGVRLSIGADAGVPIGTFRKSYNWSFGGSVQADLPVIKNILYATLNSGYDDIFAKNQYNIPDIHLIPVKAGLKYFLLKQVYIQGEAGAAFLTDKNAFFASKSALFVYAPQAGILLDIGGKNYIDAGLRFESNSAIYNGGSNCSFLGLRAAYAFKL